MKVLITGCKGQLGLELGRQLENAGSIYSLIKTDKHNLDITNQDSVQKVIECEKPDVVINCAAYTNVDGCENNKKIAFAVNANGARNLSVAAYKVGSKIIHISSDYVFDGIEEEAKIEYDAVNPLNIYGKSKAHGESLVRETNPRHFILRTAWLYGEGQNFVKTMLKLAKEKKEVSVISDQVGTPTSTVDLAKCIINLMQTESYGTYHATCEGFCSWYDFAKRIFEIKGMGVKVNRITSEQLSRAAKRPQHSVLENFMLNVLEMNTFRKWEDALEEYLSCNSLNEETGC